MSQNVCSVAAAGLLISGAAIAAENTNGSVPFAPSALGMVPFQSPLNPGVHPIPGEPGYTARPIAFGATAGSMDLGRSGEVTTPESSQSGGMDRP